MSRIPNKQTEVRRKRIQLVVRTGRPLIASAPPVTLAIYDPEVYESGVYDA